MFSLSNICSEFQEHLRVADEAPLITKITTRVHKAGLPRAPRWRRKCWYSHRCWAAFLLVQWLSGTCWPPTSWNLTRTSLTICKWDVRSACSLPRVQIFSTSFHFRLAKSKLTRQSASTSPSSTNMLFIENWTKWRLFVNSTAAKEQNKVVYGHTADSVAFREKVRAIIACFFLQLGFSDHVRISTMNIHNLETYIIVGQNEPRIPSGVQSRGRDHIILTVFTFGRVCGPHRAALLRGRVGHIQPLRGLLARKRQRWRVRISRYCPRRKQMRRWPEH